MIPAENLVAPIVFALLTIIFWESGRRIIKKKKKIFQKKFPSFPYQAQNHNQRLLFEKERVLRDIKKEASTIMGQGHCVGRLIKDRILKETRQESHRILREAKNDVEKIKRETLEIFQKEMTDMAFMINQQIQNDIMKYIRGSSRTNQRVIDKYLDNHPYQSNKSSQINKLL